MSERSEFGTRLRIRLKQFVMCETQIYPRRSHVIEITIGNVPGATN